MLKRDSLRDERLPGRGHFILGKVAPAAMQLLLSLRDAVDAFLHSQRVLLMFRANAQTGRWLLAPTWSSRFSTSDSWSCNSHLMQSLRASR